MHTLWEYVLRHGERIDRFFDGVDLPRNRLFEKDAWLPYDTASTLWRNTRKCIPNFQMEDSFQIGFYAMTAEGLGALNPVMHLTPVIATLKRLPRLWRTYSRIDHLEVIDIGPDRAVLSYVIDAPFCTDPFCNATLPLIRGFLSALTTRCGLPPASVRELCSCVDVFKRFQLELAHFGHRISQENRSVFLDGKPAGRWIRIEDEAPVPEPVKRRFKGLRAVLWEREIVDKAPNGSRLILASKGELFNLPAALLSIEWEDPTPIHRLKGLITCLHRHLNTVGRSKNHLVRRLQTMGDRMADLETRVQERTRALEKVNDQLAKENDERTVLEKRLWSSLKEKDMLLREIHHRVKNNLQVISSLLSMSANRTRDREAVDILTNARTKVETMAIIHSQLFSSQRAGTIDMRTQAIGLYRSLSSLYGKTASTRFDTSTPSIRMSTSQAMPFALVLNELISNSLKHAFGDRPDGRITVAFSHSGPDAIEIVYRDDGIGLPPSIDLEHTDSLGLKLIRIMVTAQLKGRIHRIPGPGCGFRMVFPGEGIEDSGSQNFSD